MARQEAHPAYERNQVVFEENTQSNWAGRARQEVQASRQRAQALQPRRKMLVIPKKEVRPMR